MASYRPIDRSFNKSELFRLAMSELPVTASGWPMSDSRIRFCADGCGRPQGASGVRIRRLEIHMAASKSAPYGSWKSPITSDLIVAQSITLTEVRLDGRNICWLEGRPQHPDRPMVPWRL